MTDKAGRFSLQIGFQGQAPIVAEIFWQEDATNPLPGKIIANLAKGLDIYNPVLTAADSDISSDTLEQAAQWLISHITETFEALNIFDQEGLFKAPAAIEIAKALKDNLGVIDRAEVQAHIKNLDNDARTELRNKKTRLGPQNIYMRNLQKPAPVRLKAALWAVFYGGDNLPKLPHDGAASFLSEAYNAHHDYARAIGYPICGPRCVRVDMLDRLISAIYEGSKNGRFTARHDMAEWLGCSIDNLYVVLEGLGHKRVETAIVEASKPEEQKQEQKQEPEQKSEDDKEDKATEEKTPENKIENKIEEKPALAEFILKQFVKSPGQGKSYKPKNAKKKQKPAHNKKPKDKTKSKGPKTKVQPLAHSPFAAALGGLKQGNGDE